MVEMAYSTPKTGVNFFFPGRSFAEWMHPFFGRAARAESRRAGTGTPKEECSKLIAVVLMTLSAGACVERKESIKVTPDGTVYFELEFQGLRQEVDPFAAMFAAQPKWSSSVVIKSEGKDEYRIGVEGRFGPKEDLPDTYAPADDPDADLHLSFPTSIDFERRSDGMYVHFHRAYVSRQWAYIEKRKQFFEEALEAYAQMEVKDLSREDRIKVFKAFAQVELCKQLEFADSALTECDSDIAQDHRLMAMTALRRVYEEIDYENLVDLFATSPEDQRDALMEKESEQIIEGAYDAFVYSLRSTAGYNERDVDEIDRSYERAKHYYEITEQLGGHAFKVRVKLPGHVVAHNADETEEDGTLVWEFDGKAFRDRTHELMATSWFQPS